MKMPKKTSAVTWLIGGIFAFAVFGSVISNAFREAPTTTPPKPKAAMAQEDLEINVAIAVAKNIKRAMKDPDSFKLESFFIFPGGSACYEYRARNSFNAVTPGKAVFIADKAKVLLQENDGNKFVKAWNDICTKPGGRERADGVNALGVL